MFATFYSGVDGGARTHDPQSHNLMLYQLSYIHHSDQQKDTGQSIRCLA